MARWQSVVGITLGLAGAASFLRLSAGNSPGLNDSGSILSECDGELQDLVIHYESGARDAVLPVFRDFFSQLPSEVSVRVVCAEAGAFDELASLEALGAARLLPNVVKHPITGWSRDRWVALAPPRKGGCTTLLAPRGETAGEIWPARAGDERVAADLAAAAPRAIAARRSELYFDGGDLLADDHAVFVVPRVLDRNLEHTVRSEAELVRRFTTVLKKKVVLLKAAPDHHAAMFMAVAGNRTVLVGDLRLGSKFAPGEAVTEPDWMSLPGGADFTVETARLYDAVAEQCAAEGYRVHRIPQVPARDGRTVLTYVNVLIHQTADHRVVYLPFYQGAAALNDEARSQWERLGYEVRPVNCSSVYRHYGCLHCLVNVLSRRQARA